MNLSRSGPDQDDQTTRPKVEPPKQGQVGTLLWVLLTFAAMLSAAFYMEWDFHDEMAPRPTAVMDAAPADH